MRGQQDGLGVGPLRRAIIALALAFAAPVSAAERAVPVASFDRVRVEGPFVVTIAPGRPRATVDGDPAMLERVVVEVRGTTLVVRVGAQGWGERGRTEAAAPIRVTLSAPTLIGISAAAGATVAAAGLKGDRVDLSLANGTAIAAAGIDARALTAQVSGEGTLTLAGRANTARLLSQGGGVVAADALDAGELFVWVDGPGLAEARARYTARATVAGKGRIFVAGRPKCVVQPKGAESVECGVAE